MVKKVYKTKIKTKQKLSVTTKSFLVVMIVSSLVSMGEFFTGFNAGLAYVVKKNSPTTVKTDSVEKNQVLAKNFTSLDKQAQGKVVDLSAIKNKLEKAGKLWEAKDNRLSKLTEKNKKNLLGIEVNQEELDLVKQKNKNLSFEIVDGMPDFFDWRNQHNGSNYISPVKDQGSCGSCWAFALAGMMEGTYLAHYNNSTSTLGFDLSEQDFISCIQPEGCNGVTISELQGIINNITGNLPGVDNITTEKCFSYQECDASGQGNCSGGGVACSLADNCRTNHEYRYNSFKELSLGDVWGIKKALVEDGPVMAGMYVYEDFFYYSGGIYQHTDGQFLGGHAVLIVGYGTYDGFDYWIVKNSWGEDWGEGGYFRILVGDDSSLENNFLYTFSSPIPADSSQVLCTDNDGDNYCNWGVGDKPDSCPTCHETIKDCDDSNNDAWDVCGVNTEPVGSLYVETSSPDAKVYVKDIKSGDWVYRGQSPLNLNLNAGVREIRISKVGYFADEVGILVENNSQKDIYVDLKPNPIYHAGWPISGLSNKVIGSLVSGDIDNDGDLEIIFGTADYVFYAFEADGTLVSGWPVYIGSSYYPSIEYYGTPALADLDDDGSMEIVVNSSDKLYVISATGNIRWSRDLNGYPVSQWQSPSVVDLEGDGELDLVFAGSDGIFAFDKYGNTKPGWPVYFMPHEFQYYVPAIADLNGDGNLEIVANVHNALDQQNYYHKIYVYDHRGNILAGWPKMKNYGQSWVGPRASSIGDINHDGILEIVVSNNYEIFVYNIRGELLPGWPVDFRNISGAGIWAIENLPLGDINGDNYLEIIVPQEASIFALDYQGNVLPNFPVPVYQGFGVSLADIDGDQLSEIISGDWRNGLFAWDGNGSMVSGFPKESEAGLFGTPLIIDMDQDGDTEILTGSVDGSVYAWDLAATYNQSLLDWSTFQHDSYHSGLYNEQCSDGTLENWCSVSKPKRCLDGQLIDNCQRCGCPGTQSCAAGGECFSDTKYVPHQAVDSFQ
ncbi:hypothetical protein C4566_00135 [Candidatus Parcubacteria bacterium]|nr:MAG: hypothetical protein C4566_00135 [Candidatus Parcubacteria bacterium]